MNSPFLYIQKYRPLDSRSPILSLANGDQLFGYSTKHWAQRIFGSARQGLYSWLLVQKKKNPQKSKILLPAFICESVVATIQSAGFQIDFYDLCKNSLSPSQNAIESLLQKTVLAVLYAPYFGVIENASLPSEKPSDVFSIFDFAQAAGSPADVTFADLMLLSFGMGKGVDYYGGSLLVRKDQEQIIFDVTCETENPIQSFYAKSVVGFQKFILSHPALVRGTTWGQSFFERNKKESVPCQGQQKLLRNGTVEILQNRFNLFQKSVETARTRALQIYEMSLGSPLELLLLPKEQIRFHESTFLRFPLLAETPTLAQQIFQKLRNAGVQVTYAGEPPRTSAKDLPHFNSFNQRILKLPFLGSLTEAEFQYLLKRLAEF